MGAEFRLVFVWFVELFYSVVGISAIISVDALFVILGVFAHLIVVEIAESYSIFLVVIIRAIFVIVGLFGSAGIHFKKR